MLLELVLKLFHIKEVQSFSEIFLFLISILTQGQIFVTTSSSSAVEKIFLIGIWKKIFIFFVISSLFAAYFYFFQQEDNTFILKTLELSGSVSEGDALFKMNCVGCHGITARGLVGPDLHSITERLNDTEIIKQVVEGRTPPMPSFEIDPQNMSSLLTYLHGLK